MKKYLKRLIGLALIAAMALSVFAACDGLGKKYTVTFDANGGENAPAAITSVKSGEGITEPSAKPTRTGYTFTKWYKEAACTSEWDFGTDKVTSDITLYAGWSDAAAKYTVTFDANGGENAPAALTNVESGTKITAPETNPAFTGFTFTGWYKEAACTTAWNFATDTVTANTTLYAGWTVTRLMVNFNANGGRSSVPTLLSGVRYGTKILEPNGNTSRNGYNFTGWYKAATAKSNERFDFTKDVITADTTLYAGWYFDLFLYQEYAANQIRNYYMGLPGTTWMQVRLSGMLGSKIDDVGAIINYFVDSNTDDKAKVDTLLAEIKADIANISGTAFLPAIRTTAKKNIADYAADIKAYLGIEETDPAAAALNTVVQNSSTSINGAANAETIETYEINAKRALEYAVAETYKAYFAEKVEEIFAAILEGDFTDAEKAIINARKAEIFELLAAAQDLESASFIEDVYYSFSRVDAHDFFYHAEKSAELREWVDALKAANDFNPDALERINYWYVDFISYIASSGSWNDIYYGDAIREIYNIVTAVDGILTAHPFIEILQAREAAIEQIDEYVRYLSRIGNEYYNEAWYAFDEHRDTINSLSDTEEIRQALEEAMSAIEQIAGVSFLEAVETYYIAQLDVSYQEIRQMAASDTAKAEQIDAIYAQAILDIRAASDAAQIEEIAGVAMNAMGDIVLDGVKVIVKEMLAGEINSMLGELGLTPDAQMNAIIDEFLAGFNAQVDAAGSMAEIYEIMYGLENSLTELITRLMSSGS